MGEHEPDDDRRRRRGLLEHVVWTLAVVLRNIADAILVWTITAIEQGIELVRFLSRLTWRLVMWMGVCLFPLLVGSLGHEFITVASGWFLWLFGWLLMAVSAGFILVICGAVIQFFAQDRLNRQDVPFDPAAVEFNIILMLLLFDILIGLIVMIVTKGGYSFQSPLLRAIGIAVAE